MMTDKQIKRILMVVLESKCGKDFINRFKIKLYTNSASLVIMAVMAYVDKAISERKLSNYFSD